MSAILNQLHSVEMFLDVQIRGCLFCNLAQTRLGFTSLYKTDPDFALKAKMIIALAFISLKKINEYFDALKTELTQEIYSPCLQIHRLVDRTNEEKEDDLLYLYLRFGSSSKNIKRRKQRQASCGDSRQSFKIITWNVISQHMEMNRNPAQK